MQPIKALFVRARSLLILSVSLLSGCATVVTVEGNIPTPLIERLPLTAELVLTEDFVNYSYLESDKKRAIKQLDFSEAQIEMFRRVIGNVFALTTEGVDAQLKITPEVLSVQYSAPRETQLNIYEVFIKYRIKIETREAQKLADWVITGYGKTPTATFKSSEVAFNSATNVALRDVGAQLVIGIPLQKSIKAMLQPKGNTVGDDLSSQEALR